MGICVSELLLLSCESAQILRDQVTLQLLPLPLFLQTEQAQKTRQCLFEKHNLTGTHTEPTQGCRNTCEVGSKRLWGFFWHIVLHLPLFLTQEPFLLAPSLQSQLFLVLMLKITPIHKKSVSSLCYTVTSMPCLPSLTEITCLCPFWYCYNY